MKFKLLSKNKISQLPKTSGVYAFKKSREILYIGKATNIRERVKSHFSQKNYKNYSFLDKVSKIGYISTGSEIQALILEANLIKKYQPKYNVIWKDDKNYFFVAITKEDFPRIFWTHQTNLKSIAHNLKPNFIGPFVDGKSLKEALKALRKVFPYRSCKATANRLSKKPCLWYQLERCPAPCLVDKKGISVQLPGFYLEMKKECQRNAQNILKILQGKKNQVLKDLKKEMEKASEKELFEKAAQIRDEIQALEKVWEHSPILQPVKTKLSNWKKTKKILQEIFDLPIKKGFVEPSAHLTEDFRIEAYDVSNIQGKQATGSLVVFLKGKSQKNLYRRFKIKTEKKPNDTAMIKEILKRRFKHQEWPYPHLILIDGGRAQLNAARESLNQPKLKKIKVIALAKKRSVTKSRTKLSFDTGESKLYIENRKKPILLKSLPREIFNLILQARDEAHRFAHQYHLKLRRKSLLK